MVRIYKQQSLALVSIYMCRAFMICYFAPFIMISDRVLKWPEII